MTNIENKFGHLDGRKGTTTTNTRDMQMYGEQNHERHKTIMQTKHRYVVLGTSKFARTV